MLTLKLVTPFSLLPLVTGCQGFMLPNIAYMFTHFLSPFIIAICPLSSLLLRAITDHAAYLIFV